MILTQHPLTTAPLGGEFTQVMFDRPRVLPVLDGGQQRRVVVHHHAVRAPGVQEVSVLGLRGHRIEDPMPILGSWVHDGPVDTGALTHPDARGVRGVREQQFTLEQNRRGRVLHEHSQLDGQPVGGRIAIVIPLYDDLATGLAKPLVPEPAKRSLVTEHDADAEFQLLTFTRQWIFAYQDQLLVLITLILPRFNGSGE